MTEKNQLCLLKEAGQSVWLDFITRDLLTSGQLERMIARDCLCGLTINPTIFERAVAKSDAYNEDICELTGLDLSIKEIYRRLMADDVIAACRALYPVHQLSNGRDGYVSVEVSPKHAHNVERTVAEADELRSEAGSPPNLMIKVPGTEEGLTAIAKLTAEGFNINVTLIFSSEQYVKVSEAYMSGLEDRLARGLEIQGIHSVASFFVSRIDAAVDEAIDESIARGVDQAEELMKLRGTAAIDTAKQSYELYRGILESERWQNTKSNGGNTQRLLWGSTSTKNPTYSDVKYVEELIGEETVNTIPLETIEAFNDHGRVERTVAQGVDESRERLKRLVDLGFDLPAIYLSLLDEGITKFTESYDHLFTVLQEKCRQMKAA